MNFIWFKYFTYHLIQVLASNCKQHILSPAKSRKYVIHCVISVYFNLFG
jgi:hypothetical protein